LDDDERVWITFSGVHTAAEVWLNHQLVHRQSKLDEPFELEVTSALRERNELGVAVRQSDATLSIIGEVALEIRCRAFLRNLRIEPWEDRLRISGEAVGDWPEPLEIYAILGRSTIGYGHVLATPEGRRFELVSEGVASLADELQIELVSGGMVWYRIDEMYFA
jgi:hypothetical protein